MSDVRATPCDPPHCSVRDRCRSTALIAPPYGCICVIALRRLTYHDVVADVVAEDAVLRKGVSEA